MIFTFSGAGGALPPPPSQLNIFAGSWNSSSNVGDGAGFEGLPGSPASAGQSQSHKDLAAPDCTTCG